MKTRLRLSLWRAFSCVPLDSTHPAASKCLENTYGVTSAAPAISFGGRIIFGSQISWNHHFSNLVDDMAFVHLLCEHCSLNRPPKIGQNCKPGSDPDKGHCRQGPLGPLWICLMWVYIKTFVPTDRLVFSFFISFHRYSLCHIFFSK